MEAKQFGRTQKAILGIVTFACTAAVALVSVGTISDDIWSTFSIAVILAGITALSGGKVGSEWARGKDNDEAP